MENTQLRVFIKCFNMRVKMIKKRFFPLISGTRRKGMEILLLRKYGFLKRESYLE